MLGIVVIGRNEGERLLACLRSIGDAGVVVYVDSGSTDGSPDAARGLGADVVALDMAKPFTAARARNEGLAALPARIDLVQFVDGDCRLQPGWLDSAQAALAADPKLAAVFGRRREIHPEASRYNWLCDVEWDRPAGPALYFGGDVMIRREALTAAGGYPSEMIAGEEPDLSIRMRSRGWTIACLSHEMTLHDAAITRFGQYWKRALRGGHAYAELAHRHGGDYSGRCRRSLLWGAILPGLMMLSLVSAAVTGSLHVAGLGLILLAVLIAQAARILARQFRQRPFGDAITMATFLTVSKYAEAQGIFRFWLGRLGGRKSTIIEYKKNSLS